MSFYNNDQITVLQDAMKLACDELGIRASDSEKRDRVALLIARNTWGSRSDVMRLKTYAVQHFEVSL